jgi:hypothetical protein
VKLYQLDLFKPSEVEVKPPAVAAGKRRGQRIPRESTNPDVEAIMDSLSPLKSGLIPTIPKTEDE